MKRYLAILLIFSILTACATENGYRIELSARFGINYENLPTEEQDKVEAMAEALDASAERINNLRIINKGSKIIIGNQKVLIDSNDWKRKEKLEKSNKWIPPVCIFAGAVLGACLAALGVKASK